MQFSEHFLFVFDPVVVVRFIVQDTGEASPLTRSVLLAK
jgi:hypothetical protein